MRKKILNLRTGGNKQGMDIENSVLMILWKEMGKFRILVLGGRIQVR